MKQEYLQRIFDANKILDDKFDDLYNNATIIDCNKIELMAELMELVNSSRVFKYRKKKPMDYEETLYEYADWLTMLFFFFNIHNEEIHLMEINQNIDVIDLILDLINDYNRFINHDEKILNQILSKYVLLWDKLWFDEEEVLRATLDKIEKTKVYLEWKKEENT